MLVLLSLADMETFISSRAADGCNAMWCNVLGKHNVSITTYDGLTPFTTTDDLSTPRETYFARVDAMLALMAKYNVVAWLDPIETDTWLTVAEANGNTKCYNYGAYLGNRYKNTANIVWMNGNDFQNWNNSTDRALYLNVANGIKSQDAYHIHTIELDYFISDSLKDAANWGSVIQLNCAYSYYPEYDICRTAYGRSGPVPAFFGEAEYEFQTNPSTYASPHEMRTQAYWSLLSGMCGYFYGHRDHVLFPSGWNNAGWDNSDGWLHTVICNQFFESLVWWNLVPSTDNSILTAGYGTYDSSNSHFGNISDYATTAWIADGSLVIIYMPTARTMTVDMSKMKGTTTARWFDPTDGSYATDAASPLANSGTHNFSRAGANAYGEHDWLLVLTA
jgi:hypothetical protein